MTCWGRVNRNLIAKTIGELTYEQVLTPKAIDGVENKTYQLNLRNGVVYFFEAWETVWEYLRVQPESIKRVPQLEEPLEAAQFFIDAQEDLNLSDLTMGPFLEEMNSTLHSDLVLLEKSQNISVDQIREMKPSLQQSYFPGHPKILLNKGRMGWSEADILAYSPESNNEVRFHWLAVHRSEVVIGVDQNYQYDDYIEQCLTPFEIQSFKEKLKEEGADPSSYYIMPVHPWQWDQYVKIQFQGEILKKKMIDLGVAGDPFVPQTSIRTFSNEERPQKCDVKLSLSILNTSAVRGLPSRYIEVAPQTSQKLSDICEKDKVLSDRNTRILKESAGLVYRHPHYSKVKGVPYRYNEFLGVVFRDSLASQLEGDESALMTGGLFYQDEDKKSLLVSYQQKSKLNLEEWLWHYFDKVVVPLYHLQLRYGIGLVAHGQNVIVILKDNAPSGVILKDFQGDLRFSEKNEYSQKIFKDQLSCYEKLKPEYLIHDLITGHFVTVLRFISASLRESVGFEEGKFYGSLSTVIKKYLSENGLAEEAEYLNLLSPQIKRVLLNKVRFSIGYGDSDARPKPMLGKDLINPLHKGYQYAEF